MPAAHNSESKAVPPKTQALNADTRAKSDRGRGGGNQLSPLWHYRHLLATAGTSHRFGSRSPHTRIVSFIIFNICKIKKVVSGEIKTSPICEDHWGIFAPRISEHDVSKHDLHEDPDFAKKYSLIWWENNTRTRNRFMFLQTFLTTARETECFETNDSHPWAPFPCPGPCCG